MPPRPRPAWSNPWLLIPAVAVVYLVAARVGLAVALPGEQKASPVWPPAGIALAAVLLFGRRTLAGVWAGAVANYAWDALTPGSVHSPAAHLAAGVVMAAGAAAEAATGAWLLQRWSDGPRAFDRADGVFRFFGVAPVACLIGATVGPGALWAAGFVPGPAVPVVWLTWWLGDTIGIVLVAPVVLAWGRPGPPRTIEAAVMLGLLGAVCLGVFGDAFGSGGIADPLAYLAVPFLVWAAVRLGQRGAAVALAGVAGAAVVGTAAGAGPFVRPSLHESLLLLDVFLAVVAVTALVLAAVLAEQRRDRAALASSQGQLKELNARLEQRVADRAAELARAEAARRETEDRFRAFTDHSPAVSFMKDEDGRMVFVSRACADRFGITPEDWLGKLDADIWPADLAAKLRANDRAVLAAGRPLDVVEEVADQDGTVHTWRSLKFAFRDASGRRYVGGTAIDITDQWRAEAALRASEEEFRRLIDDSPIGIYRTTPGGRILMANPAAVRLAGCGSFAELADHNLEERGPHADYDRADFKRRLEEGGEVRGLESVWRGPGGRPVHVRENARVVRGPDGGVLYYEGTLEDVTDRRRAEETLRVLFEQSSDAHLLFDAEWGVFDANPAAAAMLGFADKADLLGRHPAEFSPDYQPDGRLSMEKCVEMDGLARARGHHRFDWQHRRADGAEFPCEVTLTPVEIGGRSALLTVWHDLTDRKRAEDALRASEERFRAIVEATPDCVKLVAPDGTLLQINPAGLGMVEGDEGVLGGCVYDLVAPEFRAAYRAFHEEVCRGRGGALAFDIVGLKGARRHLESAAVPLPVPGGGFAQLAVTRDVTDRKRAEDALRQSEERFRQSFDQAPIGVALVAPDGRWLRVNPAVCDIVGYPEAELLALTFQDITHPDDLAADLDLVRQVLDGTIRTYQMEKRYYHKDGRVVWVLLSVSLIRDAAGAPVHFVSQIQDVTARKEAEERARKARAVLEDAIEALDAGLVLYDADERLVVWNTRYRELYPTIAPALVPGTTYEEVIRCYCRNGGVPPDGLTEDGWVARRLGQHRGNLAPYEQLLMGRWILIHDRRTRDGGVVSLRTDITELKRAQEAAEAASKAKSEFLANMSHEIRTPMNAILGMTDLVLDTPLAPDQREFLRLVRESGASLLRIINDILDFSKVEAGRLELEAAPFRLRDAVCRAVEPLAVRAAQKGVGLTCRVAPGVPDRVVGDPGRLAQVLVNLVGNAVKFTPAGEVVLSVGYADDGGPEFRFAVADTGIGIPAAQRGTVFEAFVQADASLTRRFGGTGLGLAISARLVGLMGGRIWVESEEGKGSTFHFTARLAVPPSPRGEPGPSRDALEWVATAVGAARPAARPALPTGSGSGETPLPAAARPLKVLVAEDNPVNQKLVERMLANRGHRAVLVGDGREALDRLRVERFDVVLMDVQMPVLDGLAATAALRERERGTGRHTPVVALTAHALTGDRERCLAAGCDEYLSKPVQKEDLYPLLEAVAEGVGGAGPADVAADTPAPVGRLVYDRAAALARVNGDGAFLAELVEMFLDRWPQQLELLRQAVADGDAASAQRQAHTVKGTLAALGADAAVESAAAVDRAARAALPAGAEELVDALDAEVARFAEAAAPAAVP